MNTIRTKHLSPNQIQDLFHLWNKEYPQNIAFDSVEDCKQYVDGLADADHKLLYVKHELVGWIATFNREEKLWFAMILNEAIHGKGIGSSLLNELKQEYSDLHGWVIDHDKDKKLNKQGYKSPLSFYLKNGFQVDPNTRLETEKISAVKILWMQDSQV